MNETLQNKQNSRLRASYSTRPVRSNADDYTADGRDPPRIHYKFKVQLYPSSSSLTSHAAHQYMMRTSELRQKKKTRRHRVSSTTKREEETSTGGGVQLQVEVATGDIRIGYYYYAGSGAFLFPPCR
ncbi:hypothetical protein OUZ56_000364 [Daphnia magna]|uniref:Uncharacterized protein n=1 Tax=Daphnia magna TaxID=35525 RepID=A0ABQ9ZZH3_9CRUS|nr:hypothetical protein OUZ56_000364 [Daphnia magna]